MQAQPFDSPAAPRVPLSSFARFSTGDTEGIGRVTNLSVSGALIRYSTQRLYPGIRVSVTIENPVDVGDVTLDAKVVRETDDGFAVAFRNVDNRSAALLHEVVAQAS